MSKTMKTRTSQPVETINPFSSMERFWKDKLSKIQALYGEEAWKIVGFMVGTFYVHQIVREFKRFPLLFLNGGYGKSTLARLIQCCFGVQREISTIEFGNARMVVQAEKYSSIPLFLLGYKPSKKNDSLIRSLFEREGYQRAKNNNGLETETIPINSTLIVENRYQITDESILSRAIMIDLGKIENTPANKYLISELWQAKHLLHSFISLALALNPEAIIQNIKKEISENQTDRNSAIIKCCAQAFMDRYL